MEPNNDKTPLTTITQSGTYKLKLIRPKGTDKVKVWEDGTISCNLFFLDDKGFCLWKSFGTGFGAKGLTILVGKFSGKFVENDLRIDAKPAEFIHYLEPACGQTCLVGVEVSHAKDKAGNLKFNKDGNPMWSYRFNYPKGSQKPVVNELPAIDDANPPF
jgi:hypothetical protein